MGKCGPRLSSRKNAKRWRKGQSSSCNPETKTHREQATWMLFKDNAAKPGITKEDLQKHDTIQGIEPQFEKLDLDENHSENGTETTINTCDTFASNYSNCSNVSFSRFLNHFQATSLLHKEMLAVLAAVTDIIKQNGGIESSTEYFAALMSTLEAIESDTSIAATLSLLGMGLKSVPRNVLNVQFGAASKIFLDILTKYATSGDFLILRHVLHCLCLLLRVQEAAAWSNSSTMKILDAVLSFNTHTKPKVRKAAQHGICAILKGSEIMKGDNPPLYHPAAPSIAKYCVDQLQLASDPSTVTSTLHILTLLKDILHHLPKAHIKTICESLLQLMTLKNVLISSCCLQVFHGLFVSRPSEEILPSQRCAQIITALYDYQPSAIDAQPVLAWLTVMQEAYLNLANTSLNLCAAILPQMLQKCMELWLSDNTNVISGTSHTIKTLMQDCVGKMCINEKEIQRYRNTIDQVTLMMHNALSYQYLEAWYHVLHLIALLIEITGKAGNPKLPDILKSLADLRDSYHFTSKNDAEYAIGAAIKVLGAEAVLDVIPLKLAENEINLKRTWLLPLLKDCVNGGTLNFFTKTLLPLVEICEKKTTEPVGGKTYELLISQIWAVLPSICQNATDVMDNFRKIAQFLGVTFNDKKHLRMSIMAALRKLITKAVEDNNEGDISELARYAKNYLPLFLNQYVTKRSGTDDDAQRDASFDTMKVYLTITNKKLVNELYSRALSMLQDTNTDTDFKESVYDVIRLLIGFTDVDKVKMFYDMCIPNLKDSSKGKEQKKAYRFLQEICGSDKETCRSFVVLYRGEIQKLLISTATEVAKQSRGSRLRCIINLIKSHPQLEKTKFLESIVPEAVIYLKDLNIKCRTSAYQLLNKIAEKFLEKPECLRDYIYMLMVGLDGSPKYCTSSMLALASVTFHYNGSLGVDVVKEILDHACRLIACPTREIVESALAYMKVYISVMPSPIVATTMNKIIDALCAMNDDCHRHFRQKVRDILVKLIRKYGIEVISTMIPISNTTLHKRLKNVNKLEEAKKKRRELLKSKQHETDEDREFNAKRRPKSMEDILKDSEDEFEDIESEEPKRKKRTSRKEAWIQENEEIVDLVDPAAARNISTTQPGVLTSKGMPVPKTKDRGFKTGLDGRLIITNDKEKDDEATISRKRKPAFLLHSDSEDDYEDDDVQSVATSNVVNTKRKRSESDTISIKSGATSQYQAGGSGIHRPVKKGKMEYVPGSEYKAPKAGGDIKKKGKPDPYAYVPLSRAVLNRRKKKKHAATFQSILKTKKANHKNN